MQKTQNLLLVLTAEERENVQGFIKKRLKILDVEQVNKLQAFSQLAKQFVRRWQRDKSQYARNPSRAGQLMTKLHDAALSDLQTLIKNLDQTAYELNNKALQKNKDGTKDDQSKEDREATDLITTCDDDELQHAKEYITEKINELPLEHLTQFRDAFQEVLTWWQSERGQVESLHMDQLGNINTAAGRVAIRRRRDELQKTILNPLRGFFREINAAYQKAAKEAADKARDEAASRRKKQTA